MGSSRCEAKRRHHLWLALDWAMMIDLGVVSSQSCPCCARRDLRRRRRGDDRCAATAATSGPHGADNAPMDRSHVAIFVAAVSKRASGAGTAQSSA